MNKTSSSSWPKKSKTSFLLMLGFTSSLCKVFKSRLLGVYNCCIYVFFFFSLQAQSVKMTKGNPTIYLQSL